MKTTYAEDHRKNASGSFDNAADHLHAKELGQKINTAIDSLPEQCGNVFKLSRFENLKYNEIAQHLNISIKTVENHMGKALKILREQLKDYLPLIFWIWSIIA
jgi:RNA polymerase sigma-70 factor (ECF subfamily)